MQVPKSLQLWFKIHFIVGMLIGLPLLLIPGIFLDDLGFRVIDPLTARLVGAAFLSIGGVSLLRNKSGMESYQSLLSLKLLWSAAAMIAILFSMLKRGPIVGWLFFGLFLLFFAVWAYYKRELMILERR